MKKIILMTVIALSFTGCLENIFTITAKPDAITKSIMDKHHIQYLNEDKKAKEWLSNSLSKNFFIHIEIDKNENYKQVKEAILHAYDKTNRKELKKYYKDKVTGSEDSLKSQEDVSNIRIRKNKQVKIFESDKNIFYTVIKSSTGLQYVKYYKKLGTADYKGFGTLTYKYGFIEPANSNKAYFYTNYKFDYNGNMILRKNRNIVKSAIACGEVYVHKFLYDDRDEYDYVFIKKTLTLLKSNQVPYKYISDDYELVKGRVGYKEISFDNEKE